MTYFDAIILGLVQGITEFLPVSSTGHLILMREMLGLQVEFGLAVDATLHFATAFAVLLYFRKDLLELAQTCIHLVARREVEPVTKTLLFALAIGTVPAVIAGLYLEEAIETVFRKPHLVAWVLIAGSILFVLAEHVSKRIMEYKELTITRGLYVGLFQTLALVPGMSRSGATISGGMLLGLTREKSARFAFLLSFPIILGAGSKKLLELGSAGMATGEWMVIGASALVAFTSGILCIHYLLKFLRNHTLYAFVAYRVLLAAVVLSVI